MADGEEARPYVTVAVATYGREAVLCDTIRGLLNQDYPDFEIVVVDQSPEHEEATRRFIDGVRDKIRYETLRAANLPKARNRCIELARGEVVVFVDDDVELNNSFLSHHAANYSDPDIWAVVGGILENRLSALRDTPPEVGYILGRAKLNYDSARRAPVRGGRGCNMSFRRKVFDRVGYFDARFPPPFLREDTDLFVRMNRAGLQIMYDPSTTLLHLREVGGGTSEEKTYRRESANERLPWRRADSYVCETVFQLKHFSFLSMSAYLLYFLADWVIVKNRRSVRGMASSLGAMIRGTVRGVGHYRRHYGGAL